jgi:hypothetical protein
MRLECLLPLERQVESSHLPPVAKLGFVVWENVNSLVMVIGVILVKNVFVAKTFGGRRLLHLVIEQ